MNRHIVFSNVGRSHFSGKRKLHPEIAENFLVEAIVKGTSRAIENSEARGQTELVNSTTLPVDFNGGKASDLEASGVILGKVCDGDELFQDVTLPEGWCKRATGHSMWSDLLDDKGRIRAKIFYKAAFYDRSAHISLSRRFTPDSYAHDDKAVVMDGDTELYSTPFEKGNYNEQDAAAQRCVAWLNETYPEWNEFTAYWDD